MLSQAVEISLDEECAIFSIREKSGAGGNTVRCTLCNRLGHFAGRCVTRDRLPPANARAVMSFMSCFKCGQAGNLDRDYRQGSNRESCRRRGRAECRQGMTLGAREQGSYTEAACGIQGKSWTREGKSRRGPIGKHSRSQTRRQEVAIILALMRVKVGSSVQTHVNATNLV